ncbi:MAG: SDR family oxidoreductase [Bdellovibrionales bacterium]|nr:SDR family oxidoreductase [Bdellovibrionales bacterium]
MKQTVLVTGAAGGLGRAVIEKFLKQGWTVLGTYYQSEPTDLKGVERLHWYDLDVSEPHAVHRAIDEMEKEHGPIQALVHCAGGFRYSRIEETADEDIEFLLNANLKSAILLVRELIPRMKERNLGRIVLISSKTAQQAPAGMSVFTATKAGLVSLTEAVAEEVRSFNINVNCLMPTIIDTPMNRRDMPQANFNSWVKPTDLADIILSLTGSWGSPINGASVSVAGRL